MWSSVLAISAGAVVGANLRWWLGIACNHWFPDIPPGTLIANLIGAGCIGVALGYFAHATHLSAEWRLFIVTGLLGSLTTFSTFSAEIFTLLQSGKYIMTLLSVAVHLAGSLIMTTLGFFIYASIKSI